MSKKNSNAPSPADKSRLPSKPRPDFPLTPHRAGYWCKKIRGKLHYFGPRFDPRDPATGAAAAAAALKKYNEQADALHSGRKPRPDTEGFTVKDAANSFLNLKQARLDAGKLSPHTFANYKRAAKVLVAHIGKTRLVVDLDPQDFAGLHAKMEKKWGLHRLAVTIQHIRSIFKHAFDDGLIDRPIRFGRGFDRPTKKDCRLHRAKHGPNLFAPEEIRQMVGCPPWRTAAHGQLRAMILLGINCGFGNADCGNLPQSALDLERGWIDYARPKTGINRRVPLWPETVHSLRVALSMRSEPKNANHAELVFVTKYGLPWAKDTPDNPITKEMRKLLDSLGINGHRNFYTLRHTFRTVADEARDQPAADFIMGHESGHMSSVYRERISNERLKAVTDHVRKWLFGESVAGAASPITRRANE